MQRIQRNPLRIIFSLLFIYTFINGQYQILSHGDLDQSKVQEILIGQNTAEGETGCSRESSSEEYLFTHSLVQLPEWFSKNYSSEIATLSYSSIRIHTPFHLLI